MRRAVPVLEFVTSFCVGGTERQFLNLVKGLRGTEFETHVGCFRAEGELRDQLPTDGLTLREYPIVSLHSPAALIQLWSLVRYLRRHRIEVVHTTGLYPNVFAVLAAWLARTPAIVASVRDMGHMWNDRLKVAQRQSCRLADVVVTNAEAVAERLRGEGYDPRRIEVIHNGIVPAPTGQAQADVLRRELGIPTAAPLVGVICRIDRVKGLEDFIDAAALVARRHAEARFVIVGGPSAAVGEEYVDELRRRAAGHGIGDRLFLIGARTDVPELLPALDVSVLSSMSEGLSNALLESMAAGLPVVATAVGGNPEVVEHDLTGLLVPPSSPASLATAIGRLLDAPDLALAMGAAGRRRVLDLFGQQRMIERTSELYRRLLSRSPRRQRQPLGRASIEAPGTGPLPMGSNHRP